MLLPQAVWSSSVRVPRPLHVGGKRESRQQQLNTLRAGGQLLFVRDNISSKLFLVNTGATCSVLPCHAKEPLSGPNLVGANGSKINTWGRAEKRVQFGTHSFGFNFILADVPGPIVGADFLARYHLAVDLAERRLF
jgi:hypothetical protein